MFINEISRTCLKSSVPDGRKGEKRAESSAVTTYLSVMIVRLAFGFGNYTLVRECTELLSPLAIKSAVYKDSLSFLFFVFFYRIVVFRIVH